MRSLLVLLVLLLVGCTPTETASSTPTAAHPTASASAAASGDYLATQLAQDDRAVEPAAEDGVIGDPAREAVDVAAREAGLVEWLGGDRPAVTATHKMVGMEELGMLGRKTVYGSEGKHRIAGTWALMDGRVDMRFQLFKGDDLAEDGWAACTWSEAGAEVTLVCGRAEATEFATATYRLDKAGSRWTLTLGDEADASDHGLPFRMIVEVI